MKFLIFIIGFIAVLVGSTCLIQPQFRYYHEDRLKERAEEALRDAGFADLYNGYEGVEVKMNHLHASEIIINVNKANDASEDEIKTKVASLVRKIPGVHTEREYVHVCRNDKLDIRGEEVSSKRNQKKSGVSESENSTATVAMPSQKPPKQNGNDDLPKVTSANGATKAGTELMLKKNKPALTRVSSELYIEWNDSKNEINIDGKLSSEKQKEIVLAPLVKAFGTDKVNDSLIVSKKLVKSPTLLIEAKALISEVVNLSQGAGSVKYVDEPTQVRIKGRLKNKKDYSRIAKLLKLHPSKEITIVNDLKYCPEFTIEKNDMRREVILSGYADKNESVNLASYVKRFTQKKENGYTFKSDISQDLHCQEYMWKASDQDLLDQYLANVLRGKLVFRKDKIVEISGVTTNKEYHKRLKDDLLETGVRYNLIYDQNAQPMNPKIVELANTDENREASPDQIVMAQAKEELKKKLKKFKIYFASRRRAVNVKYNKDLQDIAKIILSSKDKTSKIVIGGYADHSGSTATNEALSRARAASVQAKLVALGVPITRTKIEFFGEEKSFRQKWRSRRVEIQVR